MRSQPPARAIPTTTIKTLQLVNCIHCEFNKRFCTAPHKVRYAQLNTLQDRSYLPDRCFLSNCRFLQHVNSLRSTSGKGLGGPPRKKNVHFTGVPKSIFISCFIWRFADSKRIGSMFSVNYRPCSKWNKKHTGEMERNTQFDMRLDVG